VKTYDSRNNVHDAVDAVVEFGVAAIEGTKQPAVEYCEQVIKTLEPYTDICPMTGFQEVPELGYLCYVYDNNRFPVGDEKLRDLILEVARGQVGNS
jgi:hypothetical protein